MVLLLLLRVARVRTPANSFVLWRLDFTHGRWRINMGRGDVMGGRTMLADKVAGIFVPVVAGIACITAAVWG